MRYFKHILLLLTLLMVAVSGWSQTKRQKLDSRRDFVYVSASLAGQGLLIDNSLLKSQLGSSAALGVGYRGYFNHLIYSLGIEGRYGNYNLQAPGEEATQLISSDGDTHHTMPGAVIPGEQYTLHAKMDKRTEYMHAAQLGIPLLIGGEFGHLYFMGGARLDLTLYASAFSKTNITSTATYEQYDAEFHDMPNHGLYTGQEIRSERQRLSFRPQASAIAEIGYRFGEVFTANGADIPYAKNRFYIALFGEYGFLNMHDAQGDQNAVEMTMKEDGSIGCLINPALQARTYKDAKVGNWVAGVKFTMAFELPKTKVCVICKERERRNRMRR